MKKCRHCGKKANRPRGLCWNCYYDPAIGALYPSQNNQGPKPEPTEEDLNKMIAARYATMPRANNDTEWKPAGYRGRTLAKRGRGRDV